jgi:hypothetical protein
MEESCPFNGIHFESKNTSLLNGVVITLSNNFVAG